jgi:hypothetical protein
MKIEIVSSMSFDEYNERLYYEQLRDKKTELSRRQFIKYLIIGSSGLLIPIYPDKKAKAFPPLAIGIFYLGVFVSGYVYGTKNFARGDKMILNAKFDNEKNKKHKIAIESNLKKKNKLAYRGSRIITVPPKTILTTNIETTSLDRSGNYIASIKDKANKHNFKKDRFSII